MREISIRVFDDLDFHRDGSRNEACIQLTVGLNGTWRELELTEENGKEVRDTLERLMAAGSEPGPPASRPAIRGNASSEAAARNKAIRAWCRENGLMNSSGTGYAYETNSSQKDYVGQPLIRKYEAYLAEKKEGNSHGSVD